MIMILTQTGGHRVSPQGSPAARPPARQTYQNCQPPFSPTPFTFGHWFEISRQNFSSDHSPCCNPYLKQTESSIFFFAFKLSEGERSTEKSSTVRNASSLQLWWLFLCILKHPFIVYLEASKVLWVSQPARSRTGNKKITKTKDSFPLVIFVFFVACGRGLRLPCICPACQARRRKSRQEERKTLILHFLRFPEQPLIYVDAVNLQAATSTPTTPIPLQGSSETNLKLIFKCIGCKQLLISFCFSKVWVSIGQVGKLPPFVGKRPVVSVSILTGEERSEFIRAITAC